MNLIGFLFAYLYKKIYNDTDESEIGRASV